MKKTTKQKADKIKTKLLEPHPAITPLVGGLSTGSTMLNLACTGKAGVGFYRGSYILFVGDTNSGKSFISLNVFAEAAISTVYDNHRFIYDGIEGGAKMDIRRLYGDAVYDRLEAPSPRGASETIEEFYYNLDNALTGDRPVIYVLDSVDSLSDSAELDKFYENKNKFESSSNAKAKGSFGMAKAKVNSTNLRLIPKRLERSGSILVVINQTRANTDQFTAKFNPRIRSGGEALAFYADVQLWASVRERIKSPTVFGKKREIGTLCKVQVKRTRYTGASRTVYVPILYQSGVDDVGSMIDWLVEEGHWKGPKRDADDGESGDKKVTAPEFDFVGDREKLVRLIESEDREVELRGIVAEHWRRIESAISERVSRKLRYATTKDD